MSHYGSVIGRHHHVVIDCPDPEVLAGFDNELIGLPISYHSVDFVVVAGGPTAGAERR